MGHFRFDCLYSVVSDKKMKMRSTYKMEVPRGFASIQCLFPIFSDFFVTFIATKICTKLFNAIFAF